MESISTELQNTFNWIDLHHDEMLRDLQTLVQQPSVSAQKLGLEDCARLVVDLMQCDGLDAHAYPLVGISPVVIGYMPSQKSQKNLATYAHYDVQPSELLDKWHYPPFGAKIDQSRLWGWGVTDNKSGVLAFIKEGKTWIQSGVELPGGLRFIFEGEEEIGSPHLGPFVQSFPRYFKADAMYCLDGWINASEQSPEVDFGLKSVLYVELVARGAKMDLHSLNAPLLPQPVWELARVLNTLVDENWHIQIEGWYEGLWELGEEELEQLHENASCINPDLLKKEWGISEFALSREGIEAIWARAYEPTCDIAGLTSGYQGPGSKTIVPCEARAKIDFRLPPLIDPEKAIKKLRKPLDNHGFGDVEIELEILPEPPFKISVKEDISQAVIKAARIVFGKMPVVNGMSAEGTILKHVWMPTVMTGFAQPDCNLHAQTRILMRNIIYAVLSMRLLSCGLIVNKIKERFPCNLDYLHGIILRKNGSNEIINK